jgi:osomolarity two-component system response regulator SKN7
VPGWAVPPRVLLVDDDAVSRRLSSKFLQVFGCMIDVAVDGVGAVNKMNLEKYDLVLMVSTFFYFPVFNSANDGLD